MKLADKTVVVTGAGSGIGRATALAFAQQGARIAACDVDPARLRPMDQPVVLGDPSRIRNELGWAPQISLEQSLDDLLAYWRERATGATS